MKTTNAVDEAIRKAEAEGRVKDSRLDRMAEAVKADLSAKPCPACDGEGQRDNNGNCWSCSACNGTGLSAPAKPAKLRKPDMMPVSFIAPGTWTIAVETASEINGREWRKRSKRSDAAWRAVSKAMGPTLNWLSFYANEYWLGTSLRVRLTRLGGRKLDRSNLPTALKAVEDAVAFMIGADDGSPQWCAEWHQEPGGNVGVRIELSRVERP